MQRPTEEIAEIERHKYFLSEKRGYDVGWEFAEHDWEQNYASQWRTDEPDAVEVSCCSSQAHTERIVRVEPPLPTHKGPLIRLFERLFSKSASS